MRASSSKKLPNKAQRDLWRNASQASLPLRSLKKPTSWGTDRYGRDIGEYTLDQFRERANKRTTLTAFGIAHRAFLDKRERAGRKFVDSDTNQLVVLTEDDVKEERQRRKEIAELRMALYGERSSPYEMDPEWDDVVPMPADEPEGALAAIAYPENYAEGRGSSSTREITADI